MQVRGTLAPPRPRPPKHQFSFQSGRMFYTHKFAQSQLRKRVDDLYDIVSQNDIPVQKLTGETWTCHLAGRWSCCKCHYCCDGMGSQSVWESEPTLVSFLSMGTLSVLSLQTEAMINVENLSATAGCNGIMSISRSLALGHSGFFVLQL